LLIFAALPQSLRKGYAFPTSSQNSAATPPEAYLNNVLRHGKPEAFRKEGGLAALKEKRRSHNKSTPSCLWFKSASATCGLFFPSIWWGFRSETALH